MKLLTLFAALLVPGIALATVPAAGPDSEIAAEPEAVAAKRLMRRGCTANNCARAVTGTDPGLLPITKRQSGCSGFMRETVSLSTTTVTVAGNQRRQETISPSNIPTYASARSVASRYSSACSCWGITATTVTIQPIVSDSVQTVGAASAASVDFTATDPSTNHGYSLLGLVTGRDSTSSDEETGSFNYLYLDGDSYTPPGSSPQDVDSYFSTSSGLDKPSESSVWNVDLSTFAVTATWINPDGDAAPSTQFWVQSNHVYAGADPSAFNSRYPAPVTSITLTFVPQ